MEIFEPVLKYTMVISREVKKGYGSSSGYGDLGGIVIDFLGVIDAPYSVCEGGYVYIYFS